MDKNVYRILDANFNRAREAFRMIEEYCRFVLNNGQLSGTAKQLRHELSQTMAKIDANLLLSCRDSQEDVGKEIRAQAQMKRGSLDDCLTAATKRISEALRMLAEVGQILDMEFYNRFEKLRFDAYTLQKDISLVQFGVYHFQHVGLYVLITVEGNFEKEKPFDLVKACIDGGADCLQLRCKGISDKEILTLSQLFAETCRKNSVLSIINDRADIAVICGADGVHLGQDDISVSDVRRLQQKPLIVGRSTHNPRQLTDAINEKSDYAALGPVFATATKAYEPPTGLNYVKQGLEILKDSSVRHVAIGGINLENIEQVLALGIKAVAVSAAICQAQYPAKMCEQFKKIILSYRSQL
jgi:thiamine-phosphate pyrophosphorylase